MLLSQCKTLLSRTRLLLSVSMRKQSMTNGVSPRIQYTVHLCYKPDNIRFSWSFPAITSVIFLRLNDLVYIPFLPSETGLVFLNYEFMMSYWPNTRNETFLEKKAAILNNNNTNNKLWQSHGWSQICTRKNVLSAV